MAGTYQNQYAPHTNGMLKPIHNDRAMISACESGNSDASVKVYAASAVANRIVVGC